MLYFMLRTHAGRIFEVSDQRWLFWWYIQSNEIPRGLRIPKNPIPTPPLVSDSITDDQSKDELSVNEIELFSEVLLDILRIISRVRPEPKMQIL